MDVEVGNGKPVSEWSNDEIQRALVKLGSVTLPVTPTTRSLLEKRLEKLLFKKQQQQPVQEHAELLEPPEQTHSSEDACIEGLVNSSQPTPGCEYYGVLVNSGEELTTTARQPLSPFYTTKSDALRAIKSIPGARFKKFSTQASAEAFSSSLGDVNNTSRLGSQSPATEQHTPATDKPNQFPSLKTQDLNRFRILVESGDVDAFSRVVWDNPRYLINCYSDTPEILQSGFRYNTLHCAVRAGKLAICKELMSILQNDEFWRLVYPNDSPETVVKRQTHLLDLYLNMQDKVVGETPLNWACKLGHLEIVRFLLSQPAVDTNITNKYHQRAANVVCTKSSSTEMKRKIEELLNAPPMYYVPVLRAADNCTPPQLTPPCTIAEYRVHHGTLSDDRGTPVIGQAFAGPMSPAQAEEFYREWRSPSNSREWREALKIKRSDSSRGFERIGRQLAEQCEVGWTEYWDFLGCYCNLYQAEGLKELEQYLASLSSSLHQQTPNQNQISQIVDNNPGVIESTNDISRELFPSEDYDQEEVLVEPLENEGSKKSEERKEENDVCAMEGDDDVGVREDSGEGVMKGRGDVHVGVREDSGGGVMKGRGDVGVREDSGEGVMKGRGDLGVREDSGEGVMKGRGDLGVIKSSGVMEGGDVGEGDGVLVMERDDSATRKTNEGTDLEEIISEVASLSINKVSAVDTREKESVGTRVFRSSVDRKTNCENEMGGETPQSQLIMTQSHNGTTGDTGGKKTYILGNEPTKLDHDVYLAVRNAASLTSSHYPHVLEWINRVERFSENTQKSWKTPRSNLKRSSLRDSGGGGRVDTHSTFGSPLLVTSPPHSPRPQTPIPPSSHSPPHCLHTGTLSPRRHFSPLHRSVNATSNSTPSRLYHSTSRPRQVISNTNHQI